MPKYLLQVNYTLEGMRGVVANGGSARKDAAEALTASLGGTLDAMYFTFGGTDLVTIVDLPDNTAAAALAIAVTSGGGAVVRTVVLLTPEEIDAAAHTQVDYAPPSA